MLYIPSDDYDTNEPVKIFCTLSIYQIFFLVHFVCFIDNLGKFNIKYFLGFLNFINKVSRNFFKNHVDIFII